MSPNLSSILNLIITSRHSCLLRSLQIHLAKVQSHLYTYLRTRSCTTWILTTLQFLGFCLLHYLPPPAQLRTQSKFLPMKCMPHTSPDKANTFREKVPTRSIKIVYESTLNGGKMTKLFGVKLLQEMVLYGSPYQPNQLQQRKLLCT
jgi:hypothetical protein